ncbi:MAG: PAS domain-containing protein [Candidatus Eremiobacteraeota bacterium]|nr:PAS domain-containing protein [Candidatus Eremiobacteraeota bacterium]
MGRGRELPSSTGPEARHVEPSSDDALERVLGALPVATLVVDGAGRVRFANSAAAELFGIDAERTAGRALIEAIPSVELERIVEAGRSGKHSEGTIVLLRGDEERTIGIRALPLSEESGGALVVAENRTKLAALDRVRREFLADISHELRTPISAVRVMVETIQLSNGDPEAVRMFLPQAIAELERMTNLVEDLLDLARSESGQVNLQRSDVDLRRLVSQAVETFRPRADANAIELRLEPGAPLEADVDPERVTQVVLNLVDNALRHTRAGGHVRVDLSRSDGEAVLKVEDDGVGIPFKDLPHVFERFYVVDRSRARGSSGTGLGLAIVKQIVEAHGGAILAESELGSGATFVCRLPLNKG